MKTALVTGAGQGIGRAIALRLAQGGYALALVDVNAATLAGVCAEIVAAGGSALALEADLSDLAQVQTVVDRALAARGRLDVLVNNAARLITRPFMDVTEADWDTVLTLGLKTVFFAMQAAARPMIAQGAGRIVNIASISGRSGRTDQTAYAAAKAGVISLTRSAALALAPHRVNVNAVCPGVVDTPLTQALHTERARLAGITYAESLDHMLAKVPLGRLETPDDVAGVVAFLCSPESSYMTGQALNVCGGLEMD